MPTTHLRRIKIAIGAMLALMAVMLATAGAAAAYDAYWAKGGNGYACQGTTNSVICNSKTAGHYKVMLNSKGDVIVFVGKNTPLFSCKWDCTDLRGE